MASAFSTKNYFKKIYSPLLLTEFYKRYDISAIFEITEQTPRKNVVAILVDFYTSLDPSQRIDIEKELALISSVSTKHAPSLFLSLLKQKKIPHEETVIECVSDHDKVLYYYIFNKDIFDEILFFHDFYSTRGYMLYEAKDVDLASANFAMTELQREFTRIINKEDVNTECDFVYNQLDDVFYLTTTFEGASILSTKIDSVTGEIDRTRTTKKIEEIKIVYLPKDKEILISYTGSKYEKLIFLDTFLRVVCTSGYEGKVESFDLTSFNDEAFDFTKTNKGVPLLTWKVKNVTLSFGGSEKKKKMRLLIPSSQHEYGMSPLRSSLEELGVLLQIKHYGVENVAISFSFTNKEKTDKSTQVQCSISRTRSSLCPLLPYDRYARTLLRQAGIEKGFIEAVKKEKDEITKKGEV